MLLALAAIAGIGSIRLPCGPAFGTSLNGQQAASHGGTSAPTTTNRIRLATFNIHSGVGTDGRFDLGRIAEALREFDFVGLNEVRGTRPWCADQTEQLGTKLGREWLFAPFERRWFREDFGNGIVSRLPVTNWQRVPLPHTTRKGHGNLLDLTLDMSPQPIRVLVTHIDRKTDHDAQLKIAIDRFLERPPPVVLLGDLNATRDDPQIAALLRQAEVREALAAPGATDDSTRIDWVFARGLKPVKSSIVAGNISDHPLVMVELEFSEPRSRLRVLPAGESGNEIQTLTAPSRAALLQSEAQTLK